MTDFDCLVGKIFLAVLPVFVGLLTFVTLIDWIGERRESRQ